MGNFLDTPITDKETEVGENTNGMSYGLSAMQGWRASMEDDHVQMLSIPEGCFRQKAAAHAATARVGEPWQCLAALARSIRQSWPAAQPACRRDAHALARVDGLPGPLAGCASPHTRSARAWLHRIVPRARLVSCPFEG